LNCCGGWGGVSGKWRTNDELTQDERLIASSYLSIRLTNYG
jgi:hypothetical protein